MQANCLFLALILSVHATVDWRGQCAASLKNCPTASTAQWQCLTKLTGLAPTCSAAINARILESQTTTQTGMPQTQQVPQVSNSGTTPASTKPTAAASMPLTKPTVTIKVDWRTPCAKELLKCSNDTATQFACLEALGSSVTVACTSAMNARSSQAAPSSAKTMGVQPFGQPQTISQAMPFGKAQTTGAMTTQQAKAGRKKMVAQLFGQPQLALPAQTQLPAQQIMAKQQQLMPQQPQMSTAQAQMTQQPQATTSKPQKTQQSQMVAQQSQTVNQQPQMTNAGAQSRAPG